MRKLFFLFLLTSIECFAKVSISSEGDVSTSVCVYGRGQSALTQARDNASAELLLFIKGNKVLNFGDESENYDSNLNQLYSRSRDSILEGLASGGMKLQLGKPYLQGNDTCLEVAININDVKGHVNDKGDTKWQDGSPTVTVTVVGEGWPNSGNSARKLAEQDAFRRAISQVVGVYLSQNSVQSSQAILQIDDEEEFNTVKDLMSQQMSSHSSGLIQSWQPISSKVLAEDGVQVTLQVVVKKAPLITKSEDFLQQIGSPRVKVIADESIEPILKIWLSEQGIEAGNGASLLLKAKSKLRGTDSMMRLSLVIEVRDLANNLYGRWENDPSLVALPYSDSVIKDLTGVTFEIEHQRVGLQQVLNKAFINIVSQGGLVHEIRIRSRYLSQPDKLYAVLSTIGGVKDVSVFNKDNYTIARLRYQGNTGELSSILHNSLSAISKPTLSNGQILRDQVILFK